MHFSLLRQLRILHPNDFAAVYKNAQRKKSPHFTLFLKPNIYNHPRLGLSVAKKNIAKATARNRVKRIVRESFRLHQHKLPNLDIVVVVYRSAQTIDNKELYAALEKCWATL